MRDALVGLVARQEEILAALEKANGKDWWDKLGIIGGFVSGIIVAIIGGIFTYVYQSNQVAQQKLEADRQAEQRQLVAEREEQLERERMRTAELNAVSSLLPHLSSDDEETKRYAFLALNALGSTQITTTLARLSPSRGSAEALATIAVSPQSTDAERTLAESALEEIYRQFRPSVVRIHVGAGGFGSGFMVSPDGHVLTAGFVVPAQTDQVQVETAEHRRLDARVVRRLSGSGLGIPESDAPVLLKIESAEGVPLAIAHGPPRSGERILAIGSTQTGFLIPEVGTVTEVDATQVKYHRSSSRLHGFAGAPLLNAQSEVVGIHHGAVPTPISGIGKRIADQAERLGQTVPGTEPPAEGGAAFAMRLDICLDQLTALGVPTSQ